MSKQRTFVLPRDHQQMMDFLAQWPTTERLKVTCEKYKKPRSITANAYWWSAVVTPMAEFCGYTPEEMHRELCGSYFGWEVREFRGRKCQVPRRTTTTPDTLGTMEFADLIHHGQKCAAELGVPLQPWEQERVAA